MMFLVPAHFFRQLKQAYGLSVPSTLWRTIALIAVSSATLFLFGILLLALGLSG
jgi:cell division protein FtsX